MPAFRNRAVLPLSAGALVLLSAFSAAQEKADSDTKAETRDVKTPAVPDPEEIIKELEKEKPDAPLITPTDPAGVVRTTRRAAPSVTPSQEDGPNLPDGYILADRAGRLVRDGDWWAFSFRSDENRTVRDKPIRLLPCRWLENMEIAASRGPRDLRFKVSGEVTEYRGMNYLLLRKVLVVRDHGNLE